MLQSTVQRPTPLGQPESAAGLFSFLAEVARASLRPSMLFGFLGVATLSLSLAYAMMQFRDLFTGIGSWGYAAIFLVEAGNSAVILVPTPGPAYTSAMATVLNLQCGRRPFCRSWQLVRDENAAVDSGYRRTWQTTLSQQFPYPSEELFPAGVLREVRIHTSVAGIVPQSRVHGKEDDPCVAEESFDMCGRLHAVHLRHLGVHEHHVGP